MIYFSTWYTTVVSKSHHIRLHVVSTNTVTRFIDTSDKKYTIGGMDYGVNYIGIVIQDYIDCVHYISPTKVTKGICSLFIYTGIS